VEERGASSRREALETLAEASLHLLERHEADPSASERPPAIPPTVPPRGREAGGAGCHGAH
jgi:hypothetical protein